MSFPQQVSAALAPDWAACFGLLLCAYQCFQVLLSPLPLVCKMAVNVVPTS